MIGLWCLGTGTELALTFLLMLGKAHSCAGNQLLVLLLLGQLTEWSRDRMRLLHGVHVLVHIEGLPN